MTINERVKEVRKLEELTMESFGNKLGVGRSAISNIENNKRNVTDQMIKSICREFNVDYIWLTTGDKEMFLDSDNDFHKRIDRIMASEDDARKILFKSLLDASDEDIDTIRRFIKKTASLFDDAETEKD